MAYEPASLRSVDDAAGISLSSFPSTAPPLTACHSVFNEGLLSVPFPEFVPVRRPHPSSSTLLPALAPSDLPAASSSV